MPLPTDVIIYLILHHLEGGRTNARAEPVADGGLARRVLTGDAIFCQRKLCSTVLAKGGDYLFVVKDNQASLQAGVAQLLRPPSEAELAQQGLKRRYPPETQKVGLRYKPIKLPRVEMKAS